MGRRIGRIALCTAMVAGALALGGADPASAATTTITVTTTADVVAPGLPISLREAITMSGSDGTDTVINLAANATYLLDECGLAQVGTLVSTPDLDLTIDGNGSTIEQTCPDAGVMSIDAELATFRLQETTITGGDRAQTTGGIGGGIGIEHADAVEIVDSAFIGNHSGQIPGGGALYVSDPIPATIENTYFEGNTASNGGPIAVLRGTTTIDGSSFVGNDSTGTSGSGIVFDAPSLTITNSTFADNSPGSTTGAGSVGPVTGTVTMLHNTLTGAEVQITSGGGITFAGNAVFKTGGGSICGVDAGLTTSLGENYTNDASCDMDDPTDMFEPVTDPMLRPVFRNGGSPNATLSFYPEEGSPLLDQVPAADPQLPDVDQRGVDRPQNTLGDIGSIEVADCTALFTDVGESNLFCWEIGWLSGSGVTTGFADGGFHPADKVTRQSMAAFMYRLAGSERGPDPSCSAAPFPDVAKTHPFCGEIDWLVDEGVTTGFADGKYHPTSVVSRQSMAAFMYRLAGSPNGDDPSCSAAPFPDVATSNPFCGEITWLVDHGVTTGFADGGYHPTASVSRQSMAAFMYRLADGLIT